MIRRLVERLTEKIDGPLFALVCCVLVIGLATLYSAAYQAPGRVGAQALNVLLALVLMWVAAQVPPQVFMRYALPAFVLVLVMLAGVALFGDVRNGARRWLPLGFASVPPSELMKVAMPLMLARYFHRHEAALGLREYVIAFALLAVPTAMIARQPDLGTALLVAAAGFYVIFLAGLSWKLIAGGSALTIASLWPLWGVLHDYQRRRFLTLIDPSSDPLGAGYHIIQSTIAVGSGGITGKGWLGGTQTALTPPHARRGRSCSSRSLPSPDALWSRCAAGATTARGRRLRATSTESPTRGPGPSRSTPAPTVLTPPWAGNTFPTSRSSLTGRAASRAGTAANFTASPPPAASATTCTR